MMLTKDLLKYKRSKGTLKPKYLEDSPSTRNIVRELSKISESCVDQSIDYFHTRCDELKKEDYLDGLKKVVAQKFVFADVDANVELTRWGWIVASQKLREEGMFADLQEYQQTMADAFGSSIEEMQESFYADLPDFLKIKEVKDPSSDLMNEYNSDLASSFLLHAQDLTLTLKNPTREVLRFIVHKVKFHQLLFEVLESTSKKLVMHVSGPLSQKLKSKIYGKNLANFMKSVFVLDDWACEAPVSLKNKNMLLKLSAKDPLKGQKLFKPAYVPDEYSSILDGFNKKSKEWELRLGSEIMHLGEKKYSCPDLVLEKLAEKLEFKIELFHPWHYVEMIKKIEFLENSNRKDYLVGIDKTLLKKPEIADFYAKSLFVQKYGFEFRNFPSSKVLLLKAENLHISQ